MDTVVVTGGAGFIGHHLVERLAETDHVVVLDNYSRGVPERLLGIEGSIDVVKCDITKPSELAECLDTYEVSCIFHLAAINGTDNFYNIPITIMNVGILGCLNICNYVERRGIPKLIAASSAEVYQDCPVVPTPENVPLIVPDVDNPRYSYGLSKIYTEYYSYHFGLAHAINTSVFRPHNVYGPNMGLKHVVPEFVMRFLEAKKQNRDCTFSSKGPLDSVRAFCYVDDIVRGLLLLRNKNEGVNVCNLGNSSKTTIYDLASTIGEILNVKCDINEGQDQHAGSTKVRCPDLSKVSALGYEASTSLYEGLERTIAWYDEHYPSMLVSKGSTY